jgi:hypothetical protein
MFFRELVPPACCALLMLLLLGAGCTTTTIGDVEYRNGTLAVQVTSTGEPGDAFVQVTVYEIKEFHQRQLAVFTAPVNLRHGENEVLVPGSLPPGKYKLYVYILKPDERQTATIRDIEV